MYYSVAFSGLFIVGNYFYGDVFRCVFRRLANDIKSVWYRLMMGTHTEINLACLLTNRSAKYVGQKSKNEANAVYMKTVK